VLCFAGNSLKKTDFVDECEVGMQAGLELAQWLDSGWA